MWKKLEQFTDLFMVLQGHLLGVGKTIGCEVVHCKLVLQMLGNEGYTKRLCYKCKNGIHLVLLIQYMQCKRSKPDRYINFKQNIFL
jgi:hypothetical protein